MMLQLLATDFRKWHRWQADIEGIASAHVTRYMPKGEHVVMHLIG